MLEFEKKILLNEEEYRTLLAEMGKNAPASTQINHYFDTEDYTMNQKGITCRIRQKNEKYTATVKRHGGNGMECSMESHADAQHALDKTAFQGMGLSYQGSLWTERTVAFRDEYCEMVFDRNVYLGQTDYELEIEYLVGSEEYAMRLLRHAADILLDAGCITDTESFLSRTGTTACKSKRFFAQKKKEHIKEHIKEEKLT